MKRLVLALLFLLGGMAHEVRHPLQCTAITSGGGTRRRPTSGSRAASPPGRRRATPAPVRGGPPVHRAALSARRSV